MAASKCSTSPPAKCLNLFALNHANRVTWDPTGGILSSPPLPSTSSATKIPAKVCLWNLSTDLKKSPPCKLPRPSALAWSRDGRRLYLGVAKNGSIQVWDGATHGARQSPPAAGSIGASSALLRSNYEAPLQVFDLAVSPDEKQLAFVTQDGEAGVIDIQSAKPVCSFGGAASALRRVAWCSDGCRVGTFRNSNGMLRIYDAKEGTLVAHFTQASTRETLEVEGLDWRPDGRRILTAGWNGQIHIWDADRMEIAAGEDSAKRAHSSDGLRISELGRIIPISVGSIWRAKPTAWPPRQPAFDLANEIAAAEKTFWNPASSTVRAVETRFAGTIARGRARRMALHDEQSRSGTGSMASGKKKSKTASKAWCKTVSRPSTITASSAIPAAAYLLPLAQRYVSPLAIGS